MLGSSGLRLPLLDPVIHQFRLVILAQFLARGSPYRDLPRFQRFRDLANQVDGKDAIFQVTRTLVSLVALLGYVNLLRAKTATAIPMQ
jgi:hypothetical protein